MERSSSQTETPSQPVWEPSYARLLAGRSLRSPHVVLVQRRNSKTKYLETYISKRGALVFVVLDFDNESEDEKLLAQADSTG